MRTGPPRTLFEHHQRKRRRCDTSQVAASNYSFSDLDMRVVSTLMPKAAPGMLHGPATPEQALRLF